MPLVMQKFDRPWLWLEADAIPLKKQWLVLQNVYDNCRMPFAGPIVDKGIHCNGTPTIHPSNTPDLLPHAMSHCDNAFDVEWKDDEGKVKDIGRIAVAYWIKNGYLALGEAPNFPPAATISSAIPKNRRGFPSRQIRQFNRPTNHMTTDIPIVSCQKHYPWLRYCLLSCKKFASGFRQVKVLVPEEDLAAITPILTELSQIEGIGVRVQCYDDWPGKGFLRHEHVIMCSDEFTDADFVCHIDSDCMFTKLVTPEDYFVDGKPVLVHASFHWLINFQQANLGMWQVAVEKAVGWVPTQETMRRHPAVHYRKTYAKARECIGLTLKCRSPTTSGLVAMNSRSFSVNSTRWVVTGVISMEITAGRSRTW
jgi:hypothetical protein